MCALYTAFVIFATKVLWQQFRPFWN